MENYKEIIRRHYEIMNSNYYEDDLNSKNEISDELNEKLKENNLPPFFFSLTQKIPQEYQKQEYNVININYNGRSLYLIIKSKFLAIYNSFTSSYQEKQLDNGDVFYYNSKFNNSTWENPYCVLCCLIENRINPSLFPVSISSEGERFVKINFDNGNTLYIDKKTKKIKNEIQIDSKNDKENEKNENTNYYLTQDLKKQLITEEISKNKEININEEQNEKDENDENTIENNYIELLKKKNIKASSDYNKVFDLLQYEKDFKSVINEDKRKQLFTQYVESLKQSEKEKKEIKNDRKNQIKQFKLFLKNQIETGKITYSTTLSQFKEDNSENELMQIIPEDQIEFIFNELKLKLKKIFEEKQNLIRQSFLSFLQKNFPLELITLKTSVEEVKKKIKSQPEYFLIPSKTERTEQIASYLNEMKKLKKISLTTSSITPSRNNLLVLQNEFNKNEFTKLLSEKISKEIPFEEAKNKYQDDIRWKNVDNNTAKELFMQFIDKMQQINKENFISLLNEQIGLNEMITWHDAQMKLQGDIRYKRVQEKDRETIFTTFKNEIFNKIIFQFEQLCEERKDLINQDTPYEGEGYNEIIKELGKDMRGSKMVNYPDKRDKIIREKVKNMKNKYNKEHKDKKPKNNGNKRNLNEQWEKGHVIN